MRAEHSGVDYFILRSPILSQNFGNNLIGRIPAGFIDLLIYFHERSTVIYFIYFSSGKKSSRFY